MQSASLDEMKRIIGFSERDAENVRALAPSILPAVPAVVDRFYARLQQEPATRAVFVGGDRQMERLSEAVASWLHELVEGAYDDAFYDKRRGVGITHVRVGLPQHYMFTGMELLWQELERRIRDERVDDVEEKIRSLHKLLTLDLAVMLDSYMKGYAEQVREFERSAVEEKLTRAEHLAEIGQLAASLAHEIKNPLAGISGAIQIIRDAMAQTDPHQSIVTEILAQIRRLDATVKDLLQYARPMPPQAAKVELAAVVKRVLTVLQGEPALQRVRVDYKKPKSDTLIHADDRQLEQLLINLILNAAHASEDGGVIYLGIKGGTGRVRLVVRDEGRGMTTEVRSRAFEPFFTTKARGTGLGLSICRRIAEVHGGDIELDSQVGRGTTVTVTLRHADRGDEQGS